MVDRQRTIFMEQVVIVEHWEEPDHNPVVMFVGSSWETAEAFIRNSDHDPRRDIGFFVAYAQTVDDEDIATSMGEERRYSMSGERLAVQ